MAGIRLGGLWVKKVQNSDKDYLEGKLGPCTIRVYQNDYYKTDKDPAYVMYISQTPLEGQKKAGPTRPKVTPRPQAPKPVPAYVDHTQGSQGDENPWEQVPWPESES